MNRISEMIGKLAISPVSTAEYWKSFTKVDKCLPDAWIVVRLDGKGFSRFSDLHNFEKPNDKRALELMNKAAATVMTEFCDICFAYGQSDEYSFVIRKDTTMFDRVKNAILTRINSFFTSSYTYYWRDFFAYVPLLLPPAFDGRVVIYPSDDNLRDYISWRQADTHINNLYNTTFWALIQHKGYSNKQAQEALKHTVSSDKHEILFQDFNINYNNEPPLYKKGTSLIRKLVVKDNREKQYIIALSVDVIGDAFWNENNEILGCKSLKLWMKPVDFIQTYPAVFNQEEKETEFSK